MPPDVQQALSALPSATARRAIELWIGASVDASGPTVRLTWVAARHRQRHAGPSAQGLGRSGRRARRPCSKAPRVRRHGDSGRPRRDEGDDCASETTTAMSSTATCGRSTYPIPAQRRSEIGVARGLPRAERPRVCGISIGACRRCRSPAASSCGRSAVRAVRRCTARRAADAKVSPRMVSQWGKDLAELPLTRLAPDGPLRARSAALVGRAGRVPDLVQRRGGPGIRQDVRADARRSVGSCVRCLTEGLMAGENRCTGVPHA